MAQRGFTLLEVLAVTAISALLLGLAVPGFSALMDRVALRLEHDRLVLSLARSRVYAVSEARAVLVCPSADRHGCRSDGVWDAGWIAFVDRDGNRRRDPGEVLVEAQIPASDRVFVRSSRFRTRVHFDTSGMAWGTNLTVRVCPSRGNGEGLAAVMSNTGRVRTRRLRDCELAG